MTDTREIGNFKCAHFGCSWVARLITDVRDGSIRIEKIDQKNPGNNRAPGKQHDHTESNDNGISENDSDYEVTERGLSVAKKK